MKDVIVALDFKSFHEMKKFLDKFEEKIYVKVGMELFYSEGREVIEYLKAEGHKVFLDLKLCDIPNTCGRAMEIIAKLNVDMVTVHAFGGMEMMTEAIRGLTRGSEGRTTRPLCLAVTQLTSATEEILKNEQCVAISLDESVLNYASLAKKSGLDGVICSAMETKMIREQYRDEFILCTPGIRMEEDTNFDQRRVVTPEDAGQLGSNYIVVGRPVTMSSDPVEKYKLIKRRFLSKIN